jgi:hypothetical protein
MANYKDSTRTKRKQTDKNKSQEKREKIQNWIQPTAKVKKLRVCA